LTRPHRNVHFDGSFDGQKNAHRRPLSGVRCAIAVSMGSRWQIVQRRRCHRLQYIEPTFLTRDSTREYALFKISLGQHITKTSEATSHEAAAALFLRADQWHTPDGSRLVRRIECDRLGRKRRRSSVIVQFSGKLIWYLKNPSSWRPPRYVVFFVGTHNHHVPT